MGAPALSSRQSAAAQPWSLELESLRGVAIALVVLFHARGVIGLHPPAVGEQVDPLAAFVACGHTGVTLFFVLSGYLLTPPFIAEALGGKRVDRRQFFVRRARRILPLYYLFVVIACVATSASVAGLLRGLPYLFFLNAWPIPNVPMNLWPWSGVWWSLATEVQFYLLLPLLASVWRMRFGRSVLICAAILYLGAYLFAVSGGLAHWPVPWRIRLFASVFARGPAFLLGALAAIAAAPARRWLAGATTESLRRWLVPDIALVATFTALGFLLSQIAEVGYVTAELDHNLWHLAEAALWSGIVLSMMAAPLHLHHVFANAPLGALGRWSYSLYLIHYPMLSYLFAGENAPLRRVGVPQPIAAALLLAASIALSAASYRFFERRFIVRSKSRQPQESAALAA